MTGPTTSPWHAAARETWLRPSALPGLLPVVAFGALIAVLSALLSAERAATLVFDPPALMLVLNTLLLFGVSAVVFSVGARAYLACGAASILLLGCGALMLGGAALAGGWVKPLGGTANASVTVHNLGVLLAALLHASSALLTFLETEPEHGRRRRRRKLCLALAGTSAILVLCTVAAVSGWVPPFWVAIGSGLPGGSGPPGAGSTMLKQAVLGTAVSLFALTSLYTMVLHVRTRTSFLYWYSLALALTAVGLVGITVMKAVGDPIGWAGRLAQYAGGIYFLVAVLKAHSQARSTGTTLETAVDRFFRFSEVHYRDLVETVGDAILSIDDTRRVLLWNRGAERMLGYGRGEAAGCLVGDLLMPVGQAGRLEAELEEMERQLQEPVTVRQIEITMRRKDHTVFSSQTSISIRRIDSGWTATLVIRDITERKLAEEALEQAKAQAEKASQAKSEFLAHMSHEIRTPISAVIGLADVLLPRVSDREQRQFVQLIQDSARSLLKVIGDILDLSRIESGQVEVHLQEFGLRELLENLVSTYSVQAGRKGLQLEAKVGEEVPQRLRGDADLIGQVLRNLVSNAIKYTALGSVRIEARVQQRRTERLQVFFAVTDTGIGIPLEKVERLFQNFSRVHADLLRGGPEGTGLGLAISRKLVELLGGEIGVESEPGAGSTFWFTLPLEAAEPAARPAKPGRPPAKPRQPLAQLPPCRVLLAEDNHLNRLFLQIAFRDGGHTITAVENGRRAVEAARCGAFDLVLMDIQMPEMDGLAATAEIRRLPGEAGKVPVIALTAFAVKGDEKRFLQAGMDGYLSKPVDFTRLARKIRQLCPGVPPDPGEG